VHIFLPHFAPILIDLCLFLNPFPFASSRGDSPSTLPPECPHLSLLFLSPTPRFSPQLWFFDIRFWGYLSPPSSLVCFEITAGLQAKLVAFSHTASKLPSLPLPPPHQYQGLKGAYKGLYRPPAPRPVVFSPTPVNSVPFVVKLLLGDLSPTVARTYSFPYLLGSNPLFPNVHFVPLCFPPLKVPGTSPAFLKIKTVPCYPRAFRVCENIPHGSPSTLDCLNLSIFPCLFLLSMSHSAAFLWFIF